MTEAEADALLDLIKGTWSRQTVTDRVWREELKVLRFEQANTTYVRLRRTSKASPTIAAFLEEYTSQAAPGPPAKPCLSCGSTGWLNGPILRKEVPNNPHIPGGVLEYSTSEPCPACPLGAQMRRTSNRILATNQPAHTDPTDPTQARLLEEF